MSTQAQTHRFEAEVRQVLDLVIHSLTKYINGHGDALGGAVIGDAGLVDRVRRDALVDVGGVISPFNAWLILRGSVTLPLRLQQHFASATTIARLLDADPRIAFVAYPGLSNHPDHEVATRQFVGRGYGGMLAFALDGDADLQNTFVSQLGVITSAFSLGHDESLIVHVGTETRGGAENYPEAFRRFGHLRLSVGLEDVDDLVADITTALERTLG